MIRNHRWWKPILFVSASILLGFGIIQRNSLFAETIFLAYTQENVLLVEGKLASATIRLEEEVIAQCKFDGSDTIELCQGIEQIETGIYRNAKALPGIKKEDGFHPYTYEIKYGEAQQFDFQLTRASGTTIMGFMGKEVKPDTWYELQAIGDFDEVLYTTNHPNVEIIDGKVKASSDVQSFEVTASDTGNNLVEGGSVVAHFSVEQPLEEIPVTIPEPVKKPLSQVETIPNKKIEDHGIALYADTSAMDTSTLVKEGDWSYGRNVWTTNWRLYNNSHFIGKDEMATFKGQIYLQGQFVNLMKTPLPIVNGVQKQPSDLTAEEVRELFKTATVINGTGFDTTKNYAYESAVDNIRYWEQPLTLSWPQEDGVYLVRYRLYDNIDKFELSITATQPSESYDQIAGETQPLTAYIYNSSIVVGQDSEAPTVELFAKKQGETTYHVLNEGEQLKSGDGIKLVAKDNLSGVKKLRYKIVGNDEDVDAIPFIEASNPLLYEFTLPNNFAGGTLYAQAEDGNGEPNGLGTASSYITTQSNKISVLLPKETTAWSSATTATVRLQIPDGDTTEYDGVLLTYLGSGKAEEFIEKNEFLSNGFEKEIALVNGNYTLIAKVVKKDNGSYVAIDGSVYKSKQMIDATSTIEVSAQAGTNKEQPVKVSATSGPSKIKEIKVACSGTGGNTWEYKLPIADNLNSIEVIDTLRTNATCTYTAKNNANLESQAKSITASNITNIDPVLLIQGVDELGNVIGSGSNASGYVTISAVNINSSATDDVVVCVDGVCETKAYVYGEPRKIEQNATVTFVKKNDPTSILGTYEVVLTNASNMGSIVVDQEQSYGQTKWHSDSKTIHTTLLNSDSDVYLSWRLDDGDWQNTTTQSVDINVHQAEGSSGSHTIEIRSYHATKTSPVKSVIVNIDKVEPTLAITKQISTDKKHAILNFQPVVGGSGISSLHVSSSTLTNISLASYIENATLKPYQVEENDTFVFTMKNGLGKTTSKSISVGELATSDLQITAISGNQPYLGSWTKDAVELTLHGGTKDPNDFDHYEQRINGGNWSVCNASILIDSEVEQEMEFRAIDKLGDASSSKKINVKIDRTSPTLPIITMNKVNDNSLMYLLRSMSFNQYFNEAIQVEIDSSDEKSKVTILYQMADGEGGFPDTTTWSTYNSPLKMDKEQSVYLRSYAKDEAGNVSATVDSDGVLLDFTAPFLKGILEEEENGYIPRVIRYEDTLSGMDNEKSTLFFNDEVLELKQDVLLQNPGTYEFALWDLAENVLNKEFTLKPLPTKDEIDGSDESKEIMDQIRDEFEKNKDVLEDDLKNELEEKIKELEDHLTSLRTDELKDDNSNSTLKGVEGTTFSKEATLVVRNITNDLSKEEYEQYASLSKEKQLKDVYEVVIMYKDQEIPLKGKAKLSIPYSINPQEVAKIEDSLSSVSFNYEGQFLQLEISSTGRYAIWMDQENDNVDDNKKDNDAFLGNYGGRVNTGLQALGTTTALLFILSLSYVIIFCRNKQKEISSYGRKNRRK